MTPHPFAPVHPVQPPQCPPKRTRPLGAGARLLTLALALGAAACGPEAGNGSMNGGGNGSMNGNGTQDIAVVAAVTDVTARGFALTLQPGVPGIMPQDVTLTPPVAIATATAADMSNTRYTVTTEAWLARGWEYTLAITKAGYRITSPFFTRSGTPSSATTITKMTLTVGELAVEGTITGKNIRFPYGARSTDGAALTGVVSLELPDGAAVDGENPRGTEKTYSTTPTSITVRAEDGSTTQTYTVATKAYDATSNPYGVYTPAQLYAVRDELTASYRLMQDVTLPDAGDGCTAPVQAQTDYCTAGFSPIGTYTSKNSNAPFAGTFDGNGHAIKNLFMRRDNNDDNHIGLFGYVGASGEIRNLGVHIAPTGVNGGSNVGGLVGESDGTIANCYATGAVTGSGGAVGGLMGGGGGTITNAYATGAVSGSGSFVGGLVGWSFGTITNCYATGTVTGSGGAVGGLAGYSDDSIANAYATGAVSGDSNVGGLAGWSFGTVTNAYATGAVTGSGNSVGGLVGVSNAGSITQCYYPLRRPAGAGGTPVNSGAEKSDFSDFTFQSGATTTTADWKWVEGQWPQLTAIQATQTTPSLTFHTAAVTTPSTDGFTVTLVAPLNGLTKDDWALHKVTSSATSAVQLTGATTTDDGNSYTFTAATLAAGTYHLLYTEADVIVVPKTGSAGHITVTVPDS